MINTIPDIIEFSCVCNRISGHHLEICKLINKISPQFELESTEIDNVMLNTYMVKSNVKKLVPARYHLEHRVYYNIVIHMINNCFTALPGENHF